MKGPQSRTNSMLPGRLRAYRRLGRLERPIDLVLLFWPVLWGLWLAEGSPTLGRLALLLLVLLLLRTAVWVLASLVAHEGEGAASVVPLDERLWLGAGLLLVALLLALPLGLGGLWLLPTLPLAAAFVLLLRHTYLAQLCLAAAFAWTAVGGYGLQGGGVGKPAWLLFLAALLWTSAVIVLHSAPRAGRDLRAGLRTLPQLFGRAVRPLAATLQLSALWALWLAGRQAELGVFFSLGLLVAMALTAYQQWLLHPGGDPGAFRRAVFNNFWWGLAVFCGIAFHFLCQAQAGVC